MNNAAQPSDVENESVKGPKFCFVICPIGKPGTEQRVWSDDIYNHLIEPIAAEFGYRAARVTDDTRPGEITPTIISSIMSADLVVADLTFLNGNVFYELALRHSIGEPFIHLARVDTEIPFDVSTMNTIFVDRATMGSMEKTRVDLRAHFKSVTEGTASFDNPVKRHQQKLKVDQTGDPLEKRVLELEEQVAALARQAREDSRQAHQDIKPLNISRFENVSLRVLDRLDEDIRKLILSRRFKMIYNPDTGASKPITFHEDGNVGEGRNRNEYKWRIAGGRLELVEATNAVHSRFVLAPDSMSFFHTNEPGLPSVKGQSIVPE